MLQCTIFKPVYEIFEDVSPVRTTMPIQNYFTDGVDARPNEKYVWFRLHPEKIV